MGWVTQLMGWVGSGHTKWTHGQLCFIDSNISVSSFLRTLTTRHCPHSPSTSLLLSAGNATIDRYILPAVPTAANLAAADRRTDRQTDGWTPYSYIDPVPCTVLWVVPKTLQEKTLQKRQKCEKIKTLKSVIKRLSAVKCQCKIS